MIINLVNNMRKAVEQANESISHRVLLFEAIREIERLQKKIVTAESSDIRNRQTQKITPLSLVRSNPVAERVMP
jgi:hypothetical protein